MDKVMKAKELMIGDWVYDTILKCNTKVEMLSLSGIRGDCHDNIWNENSFEPVPLTTEILEKNGFKKCAGNEWSVFKYEDDEYTKKALYQVLWSADELYLEIASYTSITGEFNRMGVKFVNELQHALRLCGITREIIL